MLPMILTQHFRARSLIFGLAAILASQEYVIAGEAGPYKITGRYEVGGDNGYDYLRVDPVTRRIFVGNLSRVAVLSADSGKLIGGVTPVKGAHGTALAPEFNHGFVSNGTDRSVTMFDLKTLESLRVIKYTGVKPDSIEFDAATAHVFVANNSPTSSDVTVINASNGDIVANIDLGGRLEGMAFDKASHLFVNDEDNSLIYVVDTHSLKHISTWPVSPGVGPTGLAIDRESHRLFVSCGNRRLVVLDSNTGVLIADMPIGEGPDGTAFDARTGNIFSSNRDGTLTIIHRESGDRYSVVQNLQTEYGARTIAIDEKTGRVFLATAKFSAPAEPTKTDPEPKRVILSGTVSLLVIDHGI